MPCVDTLRVQAYFDGEVDALAATAIERHTEHCTECRDLLEELVQIRTSIRRDVPYDLAPADLRDRIARALDQEAAPPGARFAALRARWRTRAFRDGAMTGMGATVVAAALALVLLAPRLPDRLADDLVAAHVRSLMPSHLIDVASTDQHTVKPWFAGRVEVSPVVVDFTPQGYRLIGGRTDYFGHQRAAVVVYQHGPHFINVFSWAKSQRSLPSPTTSNGYHLICWQSGSLEYCAISDTGWSELTKLVSLLRGVKE